MRREYDCEQTEEVMGLSSGRPWPPVFPIGDTSPGNVHRSSHKTCSVARQSITVGGKAKVGLQASPEYGTLEQPVSLNREEPIQLRQAGNGDFPVSRRIGRYEVTAWKHAHAGNRGSKYAPLRQEQEETPYVRPYFREVQSQHDQSNTGMGGYVHSKCREFSFPWERLTYLARMPWKMLTQ